MTIITKLISEADNQSITNLFIYLLLLLKQGNQSSTTRRRRSDKYLDG
jgi:hypothetical protein